MLGQLPAHLRKSRLPNRVSVCVVVQDGDLIPDECSRSQRDFEDQSTGSNLLFSIGPEFEVDEVAHRTEGRDVLSQPVAQNLCFSQQLIALSGVVDKQKEAGATS